jgi:predicted DNA-binding transcriptional regulator AlpA
MPNLNLINRAVPEGLADRDALQVNEFCYAHGISRAMLYNLWKVGRGPRYMQIGTRRLISREAGAAWRREMESAAHAQEISA